MIYFVVLAAIAWLPLTALSFSFTRKPEQPLVVVLNSNSTNVDFRWEFSLANGDIFSNIEVKRFEKDKGLASFITLGFYQVGYPNVNTSLYNLDSNVSNGPSSGYVNFTIKDIMKQLNNKDGSKADAQSIVYVYRLQVTISNILETQVSNVETSVLYKPEATSLTFMPNKTSFCIGRKMQINCTSEAKPSEKYSWYRNNQLNPNNSQSTTGMFDIVLNSQGSNTFKCVPSNEVGLGLDASLNVIVKEPPVIKDCKINGKAALEGNVVNGTNMSLTCNITGSYDPSSARWTKDDREWKGVNITFLALYPYTTGTYHLTVYSGLECNKTVKANLSLTVTFDSFLTSGRHDTTLTTVSL